MFLCKWSMKASYSLKWRVIFFETVAMFKDHWWAACCVGQKQPERVQHLKRTHDKNGSSKVLIMMFPRYDKLNCTARRWDRMTLIMYPVHQLTSKFIGSVMLTCYKITVLKGREEREDLVHSTDSLRQCSRTVSISTCYHNTITSRSY